MHTSVTIRICEADRHQNLIICSQAHCQSSLKISCKSVRKFLHKVANRQTNNDDYISCLAAVTKRKTNMVCNFNFLIKSEVLLKVTGRWIHCKVVISQKWCNAEMLLVQTINRKWYTAHPTLAIPITIEDINLLQAFSNSFLHSCATVDKIPTDGILHGSSVIADLPVKGCCIAYPVLK